MHFLRWVDFSRNYSLNKLENVQNELFQFLTPFIYALWYSSKDDDSLEISKQLLLSLGNHYYQITCIKMKHASLTLNDNDNSNSSMSQREYFYIIKSILSFLLNIYKYIYCNKWYNTSSRSNFFTLFLQNNIFKKQTLQLLLNSNRPNFEHRISPLLSHEKFKLLRESLRDPKFRTKFLQSVGIFSKIRSPIARAIFLN